MTLFSAALFHWCILVWLLAFSYSMLRRVLWLVEQREVFILSLAVLGAGMTGLSLLFFVLSSAPEFFVLELNG